MEQLDKAFDEFLIKRIERFLVSEVYKNQKYSQLMEEISLLFNQITELSPETQSLLYEFENVYSSRLSMEGYFLYKKGLKDSTDIRNRYFRKSILLRNQSPKRKIKKCLSEKNKLKRNQILTDKFNKCIAELFSAD